MFLYQSVSGDGKVMIGSRNLKSYDNSSFGRPSFAYRIFKEYCKGKVINIGSGNGWFESRCKLDGIGEIFSTDIVFENLQLIKYLTIPCELINSRAEALPIKTGSIDTIFFSEVLEHVDINTEIQVLMSLNRILSNGGYLVLTTPNNFVLSNLLDPAYFFGHRHYKIDEVISLLESCNFEIVYSQIQGGVFAILDDLLMYFFKWFFRIEPHPIKIVTRLANQEFYKPDKKLRRIHTLFIVAIKKN